MPLTFEQYQKLDAEGFSPEEIASFEKRRMAEQNKPFLPNRQRVLEEISQRPGSLETLGRAIKENISPLDLLTMNVTNPMALLKLAPPAAVAAGIPVQRAEAAIASPALEAQAGNFNPKDLALSALRGLVGKEQSQFGDVVRTTGFGGRINEPLSALAGLLQSGVMGAGLVKGAQALAPKVAPVVAKAGQAVKGAFEAPVRFVRNIARRSAPNYITDDVAPQAHAIYQDSVQKFTPQIQKFAKEELKIPETAIKTISKNSVDDVMATAEKYGNSTDPIYQQIEQGFLGKRESVDRVYKLAVSQNPKGFGGTIDVRNTEKVMEGVFKGSLGEATRGQQGNRLMQIMNELKSRRPALGGFYREKIPTSTQVVRHLRGENISDIGGEIRLNKKQFMELRDALNNLYRENPYDRNIAKVTDQLYTDGENAGLTGLRNARNLQRQAFQAEKNLYKKGLINQKKLEKFQTFTEAEKRQLKAIEHYIGEPFIDDLDKLTAAQELQKFNKFSLDNFVNELNKAVDRKYTTHIYKQYKNLLGEKNAMDIFREVVAHRKAVLGRRIAIGSLPVAGALALGGKRAIGRRMGGY